MSNPSHKHLYTERRDPESEPPMIGMPVLAEWMPNQFVPAFRSYPKGWVEVRADGHLIYDNCLPLTWAEYPRTAPSLLGAAPDLLAALERILAGQAAEERGEDGGDWADHWEAARVAVKKARGAS